MACEGFPANSFRSNVLHPEEARAALVVSEKKTKRDESRNGLGAVVPRSEYRHADHRGADRTPFSREQAQVRKGRRTHDVVLVNMSGGGAMIEGELQARLWDKLTLVLGEFGEVECAVRWVRGNRFGLEFAHETRIDCDAITRDAMLRSALDTNFAGSEAPAGPEPSQVPAEEPSIEREQRHPLIWSGLIHQHHETVVARLRNISARGALIQSVAELAPDSIVVLDLGNAGTLDARVCWSRGDQCGLAFDDEFDIRKLAVCKPEVAPRKWAKPEYLRDESTDTSPWASEWGRLSVKELRRTLSS